MTINYDDSHNFVMVIETSNFLNRLEANQFNLFTQKLHNSLMKSINRFEGEIIEHNDNTYVVNFDSVNNCILCALKVDYNFKYTTPKFDSSIRQLKIGIASGFKENLDEIIKIAKRICEFVQNKIVITSDVKKLYEQINKNHFINKEHIKTLNEKEELFIDKIMNFTDGIWSNKQFNVNDFSKNLAYSNSQIYRMLKRLTGNSPSTFLRNFRLNKALTLLHDQDLSVSEVASKSGFNSLTYFSKCFKSRFGILPSKYIQQH